VTVLVDPIQSSSSLDEMLLSGMSSNTSKIQTEVELITSNRNLKSALSLLDLSSYTTLKGEPYDAFYKISSTSKAISVTSVKDTNLVSISITDENPKFAADLANAIATSYDTLLTGIAKTSKTTQRVFLEKQIPLNEEELQKAANALSDYKEESGVIQLDKKSPSLVTQIAYFDIKEEPLKLNIENNNNLLDSYSTELAKSSILLPDPTELTNSKEFIALKDLYSAANNELIMYNLANSAEFNGRSIYNNSSSKTSNLINTMDSSSNKMLDIINKKLLSYSNKDVYSIKILSEYSKLVLENVKSKIELSLLQERSKVYTTELDKLPVIERQVTDLERNVAVLQQVGLDLRSMLEQVKLTEAAVSGNVTVIDEALIALNPISPNKSLIMAVAILLGMALGFLMCILVNLKDNTINTRADIKKAIGENIPLLGWIPLFIKNTDKKATESDERDNHSIFVYNEPNSLRSEKVLSITSNLLYGKTFEKNQVIAISSCDMSAGKSTLLSNIAMSLVRTGAKVILIDGDLRLPALSSTFGYLSNKIGLVEVVMGKEELENVIVQPIADVPDLHILPVGHKPQVPSAILSYSHMEKIINNLKKYYDYILIDAPPVSY
ncbi:MAG: AAA family ATPase, partial [Spirochaetaceae bacterium]|nr:AAA family ATPase [Spirochaetaceae bacterium]